MNSKHSLAQKHADHDSKKQISFQKINPMQNSVPFQSQSIPFKFDKIKIHNMQAKLKVSQPNDPFEQEADHIAEQVMSMSSNQVNRKCTSCHMKDEKIDIHRKSNSFDGLEVSDNIAQDIGNIQNSGGSTLDGSTRGVMESRFGFDFGNVRIHSDEHAAKSAEAVNARAYTVGNDVVFGKNEYSPGTASGKYLLAHELTHVIQQDGRSSTIQRQLSNENAVPGPITESVGHVSVSAGITMTAEATLREIYNQASRQISNEAIRMISNGTSVEDAARWANQARNGLKVQIRASGSPITRGLAEARNIRKYGNNVGPTYDDLIRAGKTPEEIIESSGRASVKVSRAASSFRVAGRLLIVVDLAIITWDVVAAPEGQKLRTAVRDVGGVAGAWAGGVAGAETGAEIGGGIGTFIEPGGGTAVGGVIGGVVGGIIGSIAGGFGGSAVAETAYDYVEELVTPNLNSQMSEIDVVEDTYIRRQGR